MPVAHLYSGIILCKFFYRGPMEGKMNKKKAIGIPSLVISAARAIVSLLARHANVTPHSDHIPLHSFMKDM